MPDHRQEFALVGPAGRPGLRGVGSRPRTLRLDYVHAGAAAEEHFSLDGIVLEAAWPGPPSRALDTANLGKYRFEVIDRSTNGFLYSRGFASIYREWETTVEARCMRRAFHESVRFPEPPGPIQVVLKKRGPDNEFREWSVLVDPAAASVDRAAPLPVRVWPVIENGAPRDKVDLLLLGDGYTAAEMEKWHRDAPLGRHALRRLALPGGVGPASTCGRTTPRLSRAAPRAPPMASGAHLPCAPPTTRSAPSATS